MMKMTLIMIMITVVTTFYNARMIKMKMIMTMTIMKN